LVTTPEPSAPLVGVLALQGAFARHCQALERCGADTIEVRKPEELDRCDALILPGGESTTMLKLLDAMDLFDPLGERLRSGMPVFGTCAGMILVAAEVLDGRADQRWYAAIDVAVRRNGYGRQIASFEADLTVDGLDGPPLRAAFIRAPRVERVGPEVEVLAEWEGDPVLCRQASVLVAAFHPELTDDDRLHRFFLDNLVGTAARQSAYPH
jgi:5'-phosphate synthase pdxT subunit